MSVVQRVLRAAGIIWLAATLAFLALRVLPGDAITTQLTQAGVPAAAIAERRAALGLTDPLPVQYVRYLVGLLRGDLGQSLLNGQPVAELIASQLPPTLTLAGAGLAVAIVVGLALGLLAALELPLVSSAARVVIILALSTPIYWTGTVAIYLFSAQLGLFPSSGAGRLSQLVLPALVLGFHTASAIARVVQANVRQTLQADFVRVARAKGLPEWVVLTRHALRPGLVPVIAVVALQAGFLLSGTVITETLFARPGIGRVVVDATTRQDYPVAQGVVVLAAITYTLVNMAAEILYRLLDPRVGRA